MPAAPRDAQRKFVAQVYRLRILGLGLGTLPVAGVLYQQQAAWWLWTLIALNGYVWPHVAYLLAARNEHPLRVERLNLILDAGFGGAWVAMMQFNLLPSALLVTMLAMDRMSAGGWRLLGPSLALQTAVCLLAAWLQGFPVQPVSDMLNVLTCLPMLVIYPIALSLANFALAQRVRQQNRLLDQLSRTDPLTGLPNRAHWLEAAARELQRFQRSQRPATLILLDVDGLKPINDRAGHAAGDALLCRFAGLLRNSLRDVDTPGRLGGDEFGIVLPETGIARAAEVAERIRRQAEHLGVDSRHGAWTLSLGVAELGVESADVNDWMHRADLALYRAKSQGRNRVCVAGRATSPAT
ncbi:diguanylate cyclase [Frateuria defendens]|uniref:diguanylate cyclase n=1 Tax=Frateuria defendens TaxID=2219559 RepID=UPI00066FC724|nr:diguanylate cyclase [Frateuria defendens]